MIVHMEYSNRILQLEYVYHYIYMYIHGILSGRYNVVNPKRVTIPEVYEIGHAI